MAHKSNMKKTVSDQLFKDYNVRKFSDRCFFKHVLHPKSFANSISIVNLVMIVTAKMMKIFKPCDMK